jgi:hypothetical protein
MDLPTIIDIEASGLGRGTYPIEIGFINGAGEVGCNLIKPEPHWTVWHQDAERLHGLSREILLTKGKPIVWIADWLNENFSSQTIYSDGWMNDMCWMGRLFDEAERTQRFKIESLLALLDNDERDRWTPVHDQIIKDANLTRHRASSDAKMIQDTYAKLKGIA